MQIDQLQPNGLLVFSGPANRRLKARIDKINDGYLQLEILESELQARKVGTFFKVPISYLMDCGLYQIVES